MTTDLEERLRQAFEYRAEHTVVDYDVSGFGRCGESERRSMRLIAAVAAAAVVVVGGLVVLDAARTEPTPPANQTPSVSIPDETTMPVPEAPGTPTGDIVGLSLDDWIGLSAARTPEPSWEILNTAALPDGVKLIDQSGSVILGPPAGVTQGGSALMYRYVAHLRDSNDTDLTMMVSSMDAGPCTMPTDQLGTGTQDQTAPADTTIDINGTNATLAGSRVCWELSPGVFASIEIVGSTQPSDAAASTELARQVGFVDVERLPRVTAPFTGSVAPRIGDFGGTVNGVPWLATIDPSSLRTMNIYANGRALGGFENDRLSQPNDIPAETGELTLTGIPGAGAVIYGYLSPEVVAVRVTNDNADTVELAVLQRRLETFFAVPIPEGVTVETLEFLRADGSDYASAAIDPLPNDLDGTYGRHFTISRSPAQGN